MMERGKKNILDDGLGKDLMDAGRFCFSCEQIFANRKSLEQHYCSAASHICSCGTEFLAYTDMLDHSTTHEPGHQVLDHGTIKKRRIEKRMEEEKQLNRIQTGDVIWKTPAKATYLSAKTMLPISSAYMPQVSTQSSKISQVPQHSVSQASLPQNEKDMQNIFAGVGAPTVDLWTVYQPVVLVQTVRKFNQTTPYACARCGQGFTTRASLISHHSSHVTDKVAGCIGCGLLLSSKKLVPRFHVCKATNTLTTKFRIITARPPSVKPANVASPEAKSPSAPWAASYLQLKSQNPSAASRGSRSPLMTSTLQLENQKIGTYNKSKLGLHISPSMGVKSQKPNAFRPYTSASLPSMSQSPNHSAFNKSSHGLAVTSSGQLKMSTQSELGLQMQMSSESNGFACRVCHLPFETAQLLQRHKCAKAQEFMAKHVRGGKAHYRLKRVTPVASPNPTQMNGERKPGVPVTGNIKKNQVTAVGLDKVQGAVPLNGKTGVNMDDDCYIVESGPDKSAEMIYQVTSSVPIKT